MKYLFFILFLLTNVVQAQYFPTSEYEPEVVNLTTLEKNNIKGKVKTIKETKCRAFITDREFLRGHVVNTITYNYSSDGNIISREMEVGVRKYMHGAKNELIYTGYDSTPNTDLIYKVDYYNGKPLMIYNSRERHEYGFVGNKIKFYKVFRGELLVSKTTYFYHKDLSLNKVVTEKNEDKTTKFYGDGKLVHIRKLTSFSETLTTILYYEGSNLIKRTTQTKHTVGKPDNTVVRYFNIKGDLNLVFINFEKSAEFNYNYDSNGNWISKEAKNYDNKFLRESYIIERTLTYQ